MIEATQNHAPAMGVPQKSKPPKHAARPLVMLLEIVWMVALAAALCWKFVPNIEDFVPKSDRRGAAIEESEQAAAQTLRARKVLVIEEGPGHGPVIPAVDVNPKNKPRRAGRRAGQATGDPDGARSGGRRGQAGDERQFLRRQRLRR